MGNTDDIQRVYMDLEDSMARLVGDQGTAFSILWFDIHRWLEPEGSGVKADLCGDLTKKITGQNNSGGGHSPGYYYKLQNKFGFGAFDELGTYWERLMEEEKCGRLWLLLECLETYYKKIMPYVKNEMIAWWSEHGNDEIPQALKLYEYNKHRAKVRATMQIVEAVACILNLQGKDRGVIEED